MFVALLRPSTHAKSTLCRFVCARRGLMHMRAVCDAYHLHFASFGIHVLTSEVRDMLPKPTGMIAVDSQLQGI